MQGHMLVFAGRRKLRADSSLSHRGIMCCYITGLLLLVVNNLVNPDHRLLSEDQRLVEVAVHAMAPLVEQVKHKKLAQVHVACRELSHKARIVMERTMAANATRKLTAPVPVPTADWAAFDFEHSVPSAEQPPSATTDCGQSDIVPVLGNMMGSALGSLYCREDPEAVFTEPPPRLDIMVGPDFPGGFGDIDLLGAEYGWEWQQQENEAEEDVDLLEGFFPNRDAMGKSPIDLGVTRIRGLCGDLQVVTPY
jgi:hypothetical protein